MRLFWYLGGWWPFFVWEKLGILFVFSLGLRISWDGCCGILFGMSYFLFPLDACVFVSTVFVGVCAYRHVKWLYYLRFCMPGLRLVAVHVV